MMKMTANDLLNHLVPDHDRNTCNDIDVNNGFYTQDGGENWMFRCTRCAMLEVIRGIHKFPEDASVELYINKN